MTPGTYLRHAMPLEDLKREAYALIDAERDESRLEDIVERLRAPAADPNDPNDPEALVSFDADGTGYTAQQLGDTLDERVRAMRRGEGMVTLKEFEKNMKSWRRGTK